MQSLRPLLQPTIKQASTRLFGSPGSRSFTMNIQTKAQGGQLSVHSKYKLPSGHHIPVLGYGVYQTPAAECQSVVEHALKSGYRHIDSAVVYRNEEPSAAGMLASGLPRSSIFFTSKIPPKSMTYKDAKRCIDETISKIGKLEYVDLYLLHAPFGGKEGRLGAWKALVEGVESGKIRSIGVSNYGVHHLNELQQYIANTQAEFGKGKGGTLSVNQVELHPWLQRKDIVDWCRMRGVMLEAYSPLVRATRMDDPLLAPLCKKYEKTPAQILIRWSLQMGFIPLPKSVTTSRIEENCDVYDFQLSEDEMKSLHTDEYSPCTWDPTKEP